MVRTYLLRIALVLSTWFGLGGMWVKWAVVFVGPAGNSAGSKLVKVDGCCGIGFVGWFM